MYLPRDLLSKLYLHLQKTHHPLSPPVLVLVGLDPDALCACRILTRLFKRDYIPHKIQPIVGYSDLEKVGRNAIRPMMNSQGGSGGVVICLGVGGLVDLDGLLGLEEEDANYGGIEVWIVDARRPWNLGNVFGGCPATLAEDEDAAGYAKAIGLDEGKITNMYKPGKGGIVVFDDGDIEDDLEKEKTAYLALVDMPEVEDGVESDGYDTESEDESQVPPSGQKRKSWSDQDDNDDESDDDRPTQRRRSNSSSPILDSPHRPPQRGLLSMQDPVVLPHDGASMSPTPAQPLKQPSARTLRRRLLKLRRKHESVLIEYYSLGASYSEPISSMMYSLASELGREDNDLLWLTIVGVTSMDLYGRTSAGVAISTSKASPSPSGWLGTRGSRIRQLLRDEVRRLNPPELTDSSFSANRGVLPQNFGIIPTTARSPTDTSIRLSPEPNFLMIRHWSLYESMLHSPYLAARLHLWSETGRKRLHKLLAKMGVSLMQCRQSYTHMDMELKRNLRMKLLQYAALYGLDDLVPAAATDGKDRGGMKEGWGFVRSWGWRATLSAQDVGVIIGSVLEVGKHGTTTLEDGGWDRGRDLKVVTDEDGLVANGEWVSRFWDAYDALEKVEELKQGLPIAQKLQKAILRQGTSLIEKNLIKHLNAFRMCIVKDGPDVRLFSHPAALTKLALWVGDAIAQMEREKRGKLGHGGRGTPFVIAGLNESRGVYTVVGTGGGGGLGFGDRIAAKERQAKREARAKARELKRQNKDRIREEKRAARQKAAEEDDEEEQTESEGSESSDSDEESDEDDDEDEERKGKGFGRNRFGNAFQEVVAETNARVRIDSFEHCVVEVKKEDLAGFLESLSTKAVVG